MMEKLKNSKFVLGWKKLCADLKPMSFTEKCEHLWTYYKSWLVVLGFILLTISFTTTVIGEQRKEVMVSGMMININIDQLGMNYLTSQYAEDLGATRKTQVAEVDYTSFGDPLNPESGSDSSYAAMILPARVEGRMLDYMIFDKSGMEYYIAYDLYMDLEEFFTEEEFKQLAAENRIIYAKQEDELYSKAIAVSITELPFVQEYIAPKEGEEIYFSLSGSSPRPEMCRDVWERLNNWEKPES